MFIVILFLLTVLVVSCVLPIYEEPTSTPVVTVDVPVHSGLRAPMPRPRRRKLAE